MVCAFKVIRICGVDAQFTSVIVPTIEYARGPVGTDDASVAAVGAASSNGAGLAVLCVFRVNMGAGDSAPAFAS